MPPVKEYFPFELSIARSPDSIEFDHFKFITVKSLNELPGLLVLIKDWAFILNTSWRELLLYLKRQKKHIRTRNLNNNITISGENILTHRSSYAAFSSIRQ